MNKKIEINSIWEDESLLEIKIFGSNGDFSGTANCYTNREKIIELGEMLNGFPKSLEDKVYFSTGESDTSSYFSLTLKILNGSGHIKARIKIAHIQTFTNTEQENYLSEFDLPLEPAAIDNFSKQLIVLSKSRIGECSATLQSKT
jgi:hypothetical protein